MKPPREECPVEQIPDGNVPQRNRWVFWIFYIAALFLLLGAIACVFVRKPQESVATRTIARQMQRRIDIKEQRESTAIVVAAAKIDVQQLLQNARYWRNVSVTAAILAMLFWGIAHRHREKQDWVGWLAIILFSFYVLLEVFLL